MQSAAIKTSHGLLLVLHRPKKPNKLLMGRAITFITGKQVYDYYSNDIITPRASLNNIWRIHLFCTI